MSMTMSPRFIPNERKKAAVLSLSRLMSANVKSIWWSCSLVQQSAFFSRGDAGPFVYDIVSEVEIFGYIYTEVFDEIFLGGEFRLF